MYVSVDIHFQVKQDLTWYTKTHLSIPVDILLQYIMAYAGSRDGKISLIV